MPIVKIREYLVEILHLDLQESVLVAVSGGPDSLCLLDVLQKAGVRLSVAHFDHQLRPSSGTDAAKVAVIAQDYGLPFVLGKDDVAAMAASQGLSIEEAARMARYRFLFQVARDQKAQAVLTAHTADDQAETVLMHFIRGSGLAGLKGMRPRSILPEWDEAIPLVRPFLDVWRSEVETYCLDHGLDPIHDETNQDVSYFRNRLRHQLLPELAKYNPQVRQALTHTAVTLQGDYEILMERVIQAWDDCLLKAGDGYVAFDQGAFRGQPVGLQRALIRQAASGLRLDLRDFDFRVVERAIEYAKGHRESGQVDLAAGLRILKEGSRLYVADWKANLPQMDWPALDCGHPIPVDVGQKLTFINGWRLTSQVVERNSDQLFDPINSHNPFEAWLDLESLSLPLSLRCKREGDRFQPLGLNGHTIKLSDFFINGKVPRRARESWPLLLCGEVIAWVPGFQPGYPFRLQGNSQRALHLILEQKDQAG